MKFKYLKKINKNDILHLKFRHKDRIRRIRKGLIQIHRSLPTTWGTQSGLYSYSHKESKKFRYKRLLLNITKKKAKKEKFDQLHQVNLWNVEMVDENEHKRRRVLVIQVRCYDYKYQIKGFSLPTHAQKMSTRKIDCGRFVTTTFIQFILFIL